MGASDNPFALDFHTAEQGMGVMAQVLAHHRGIDAQREQAQREAEYKDMLHRHTVMEKVPEFVAKYGVDFTRDIMQNAGITPPSDSELVMRGHEFMRGPNAAAGAGRARMEGAGFYPDSGRNQPGSASSGGSPQAQEQGRSAGPGAGERKALGEWAGEQGGAPPALPPRLAAQVPMSPLQGQAAGSAATEAALARAAMLGGQGATGAELEDQLGQIGMQTAPGAMSRWVGSGMPLPPGPFEGLAAGLPPQATADYRTERDKRVDARTAELTSDPALRARSRAEADTATAALFGYPVDPSMAHVMDYDVKKRAAERPRAIPRAPQDPTLGLVIHAQTADQQALDALRAQRAGLSKKGTSTTTTTTSKSGILQTPSTKTTQVQSEPTGDVAGEQAALDAQIGEIERRMAERAKVVPGLSKGRIPAAAAGPPAKPGEGGSEKRKPTAEEAKRELERRRRQKK